MGEILTFFSGSSLEAAGAWLLGATFKGAILLGMFSVLALLLRGASASTRHFVWTLGVLSLFLLPPLSAVMPAWEAPGLPDFSLGSPAREAPHLAASGTGGVPGSETVSTHVVTSGTGDTPGSERASTSASSRGWPISAPAISVTPGPRAFSDLALDPDLSAPGPSAAGMEARGETRTLPFAPWRSVLAVLWGLGALAVGVRFLRRHAQVRGLGRRHTRFPDGRVVTETRHLSRLLRVFPRVRVLASDSDTVPVTWGVLRPVLLMPRSAESWPRPRLRDVLLHELAHVRRRDHLVQILAEAACALYWCNPLVWLAALRLRTERELACDDSVLNAGSRPSDYAGHLLDVVRSFRGAGSPALAAIALGSRHHLRHRFLSVLDDQRRRGGLDWRTGLMISGAAILILTLLAAVVPVSTSDAAGSGVLPGITEPLLSPFDHFWHRGSGTSTSIEVNDDKWRVKWRRGNHQLRLRSEGKITFNGEETDVVAVERGGYFRLEERLNKTRTKVELTGERDGTISRRYWADGDEREFDDEARQWLAEILPQVFRETGFNLDERVERILNKDGVDGVLAEISLISSDHVKASTTKELLKQADPDPDQLRGILAQAGEEIESDYALASLLTQVAGEKNLDDSGRIALARATRSIGSDYEQRRVLNALAESPRLGEEAMKVLLEEAVQLGSDYEQAQLLVTLARTQKLTGGMSGELAAALKTLGSDYEHRRALNAILAAGGDSPLLIADVLESAKGLGSDYEMAELLKRVVQTTPIEGDLVDPFFTAVRTLGSDYEQGRVLSALLENNTLAPETLIEAIETGARGIGSDYELAKLLVYVANHYPMEGEVRAAYLKAVGTIGSKHEQGKAKAALVDAEIGSD